MSRTFEIPKHPYDNNVKVYLNSKVAINPGLTVLVGCNGSGKTTLLIYIKETLKALNIPYISYDNLMDGSYMAISTHMLYNDIASVAELATSSEGEQIYFNLGNIASDIGRFIQNNRDAAELFILLDAIDSGLSIDNILEIKEGLFKAILSDNPDKDVYILVCANSFEMSIDTPCLDVRTGKYRTFKSYNSYRNFILKSRTYKENR